jgi:hypothetical protein
MESARVQLAGNRIKAAGRIIGGDCPEHQAFSASYDLVTDDEGATQRLSLRTTIAGGERQASVSRDEEGYWMVDNGDSHLRSTFGGALDVDVMLSPFFNTLPIRRLRLAQAGAEPAVVPVVYMRLPELLVESATLTYTPTDAGIQVLSPVSISTVTVDHEGFLLNYPGLSERI